MTDSCLPLQTPCNGFCVNKNLNFDNPDKRYLCQEDASSFSTVEGVCKKTFETCGGKCLRPCFSCSDHYYCKATDSCVSRYQDCEDGCPGDQLYCKETDQCQISSQPCFGECTNRYKGKTRPPPRYRLQYCEATNKCTPYTELCNNTCRPFEASLQKDQGLEQYDPFPAVATVLCTALNICYVTELPQQNGQAYRNTCKAKQMCEHQELKCQTNEYICQGKCTSISQTCNVTGIDCLNRKDDYIHYEPTPTCIQKFAGVFHNYRWCDETRSCIPPNLPCNGVCFETKPRLALCEVEGRCINIATPCQGECLAGRVKCPGEERCVHKTATCT